MKAHRNWQESAGTRMGRRRGHRIELVSYKICGQNIFIASKYDVPSMLRNNQNIMRSVGISVDARWYSARQRHAALYEAKWAWRWWLYSSRRRLSCSNFHTARGGFEVRCSIAVRGWWKTMPYDCRGDMPRAASKPFQEYLSLRRFDESVYYLSRNSRQWIRNISY